MNIGKIEIEKTACLAPMASIADRAYRTLCKEFGASYLVSEMISAKGMCYSDRKTEELCTVTDAERPLALQIFGDEPEYIEKAVELLKKFNPTIIDINMGCPVPKVAGNGSGSALMKTPKLAGEVVKAAVKNADCPVTVKIRSGWDNDNLNAVEVAKILEDNGASAIAVHGRTRVQMYTGKADWSVIRDVKNAVSVPVIGNGDVVDIQSAVDMYEQTGCDLVMIGRGSYGRPWVFSQIREFFDTGKIQPEPDFKDRLDIMLNHARMIILNKGEYQGIREARKIIGWYIKGVKNAANYRNICGTLTSFNQLEELTQRIYFDNKEFLNENINLRPQL